MQSPRIFLSYDVDHDDRARARFARESRTPAIPITLQSYSTALMLPPRRLVVAVAEEMRLCDLMIVLVGRHTAQSAHVLTEIRVARGLQIPYFGVYVEDGDEESALPDGLAESATLFWAWPSIAATINRLTTGARTG